MTKLASLLGRKPTLVAETPQPEAPKPQPAPGAPAKAMLDLDQDLFFPIASQLGGENEVVRNLLIDAEHKITELDTIKTSLGRLVDPVSKALRAFEEAKTEKLSLQSVLNNTRIAYSKMRENLTNAEKKAATLDTECIRLREVLAVAQQSVGALESNKTEQSAELAARRAQISELQRLVQQQATDLQITRDENQRSNERSAVADRRLARLEAEAAAASQRCMLAEQERASVQGTLDKALHEAAHMARRLAELEKALTATQSKLLTVEAFLAEAQSERATLAATLDEASETHRRETSAQNARLEALQARSQLSDRLLDESRQALAARADEINAFDRRLAEATLARSAIEVKFSQIENVLEEREAQVRELEVAHDTLTERNADLVRAVSTRESAYNRAQEKIQSQDELIQMLEQQLKGNRETAELQIEDLKAQLQREQLDRTMAEGALEAGRKDIARLLRELSTLKPGAVQEALLAARVQDAA